jgi:hypothetical protein
MASDFTLAEARTRVRNALAARGTKFYSDDEVTIALKDAYREVCEDTKFHQTYAEENSIEDQAEYGWPDCLFIITHISYDGVYLPKASDHWMSQRRTDWRGSSSGTPSLFYLISQTRYGIWAPPDTAGDVIRIEGYGYPQYPSADGVAYIMPAGLGPALIFNAAARLSKKDIGGEGAKFTMVYEAEYQSEKEKWLGIYAPHHDTAVGIDGLANNHFSPHRPLTTLDYGGIIVE